MNPNDTKMFRFGIALAILIARSVRERTAQSPDVEAGIAFERADAFILKSKEVGAYPEGAKKP